MDPPFKNILTGQREKAHARRLALHRADEDCMELGLSLLDAVKDSEANTEIAEDVRGIRSVDDQLQVLVEWTGLPLTKTVIGNRGPKLQVAENLPEVLGDFRHTSGDRALGYVTAG